MIRVMICDDIAEIRSYYVKCVNSQSDMQIVCQAEDQDSAVEEALKYRPDIILMDVQMDVVDAGILATEQILRLLPETKVIILTIHNDDSAVVDAYMAGAVDYILKTAAPDVIRETIRKVAATEDFLGKRVRSALKSNIVQTKKQETRLLYLIYNLSRLTSTEKMILEQLWQKKKRKKIAEENFLSEETIKIHIRHILKKLNFRTTSEMIRELEAMGVLELFFNTPP